MVILQCVGGDASACVRGCACDAIIDPALDNSAIATVAIIRNLLITGAMATASKHVIWHQKVSCTALVQRDRPLGTAQSSGSAIRS